MKRGIGNKIPGPIKDFGILTKELLLILGQGFLAWIYRVATKEYWTLPPDNEGKVRRIWSLFKRGVFAVIFYFLAVDFNLFWLFGSSPGLDKLEKPKLELASQIYTSDGVLIGKYFKENRSPIEYHRISPWVVQALLATEDARFYGHSGIDPKATGSVLVYLARGDNRGGSTLTQQLAKNLYKIRKDQSKGLLGYVPGLSTIIAKTKEWITAIKLERSYTKEEILTLYLNTVDFGYNSFGIKTAAVTYFSQQQEKLRIEEAAMLIGMLKGTTLYNPKRNYGRALRRRNTVLSQMMKYGFINQRQFDSLSKIPIRLKFSPAPKPDGVLTYYGITLTNYLKDWIENQKDKEDKFDLYTDGLKIYITIDSRIQKHAEEAVAQHMKVLQKRFDDHWRGRNPWCDKKGNEIPGYIERLVTRTDVYKKLVELYGKDTSKIKRELNRPRSITVFDWNYPNGKQVIMSPMDSLRYYKKLLHAGLMTMDPFTGNIKAWVGGLDYRFFQYDHVRQSKRQPGSTFKAFVYAAAMDKGYSPCYKLPDEWKKYEFKDTVNGVVKDTFWIPKNAVGYYSGMNVPLRYALGRSINSIAARLTDMLTPSVVAQYAHRLGIKSKLHVKPSIGLGSSDVTLYEMVGAYGAFVNKGEWVEPILVSRIENHNGNIIATFSPKKQRAISIEAAWLMVHMLKGTLQEPGGTAQGLFQYQVYRRNELGGKTGTSSNQSDGWFMGITKNLVTGVWVGAEERAVHFRTMRLGEGSKTALPIYGLYMERIYADKTLGIEPGYFPKPDGFTLNKNLHCPTYLPKRELPGADSTGFGADSLNSDPSNDPVIEVL